MSMLVVHQELGTTTFLRDSVETATARVTLGPLPPPLETKLSVKPSLLSLAHTGFTFTLTKHSLRCQADAIADTAATLPVLHKVYQGPSLPP
ncbi:uncharacterized protein FFMR_01044 [Fusarium fujikuroi]|uniref:Uncharacterized protein n=1 Tax=Fusarium fujikuroi TaxID=5127 RepID=A0A2H3REI5_FUSFU|nr:uncharacterized protein FFE2_01186 [Fusarium fujikuroi]SCN71247.1 uncharacterized protein FFC1_01182 [Fusarium fujikuroi]SCN75083.1 uncharacterized protein FFM5_01141 [Fusarium fujikuroi]SCO28578.1 uncharacterized protein FFMR_01044 [Fusarium fujikuroi]SCO29873.1 uncharacterized protein FFNC_01182 [Fusarium fujikuroi]